MSLLKADDEVDIYRVRFQQLAKAITLLCSNIYTDNYIIIYHFCTILISTFLHTGWTKKKWNLKNNGHNSAEIHQKGKKLVFRKILHKCCRIGTKPFKINGEMAKKNKLEVGNPLEKWVKIHFIRFVPF